MPAVLLVALLTAVFTLPAAAATSAEDLLRMTEQLDQMDKMDLDEALGKADRCTAARDFDCTESQIVRARKFALSEKDRTAIARSQSLLLAEKRQVEEEEREMARRQRQLEEAEARMKESEEQAERMAREAERESDDSASGMSAGQALMLLGSVMNQQIANQQAQRMAAAQRAQQFAQNQARIQADLQRQQERFARERSELEARRANLQRQQAAAQEARTQQDQMARAQQAQREQLTQQREQLAQREQVAQQQARQAGEQRQREESARVAQQRQQQQQEQQQLVAKLDQQARSASAGGGSSAGAGSRTSSGRSGNDGGTTTAASRPANPREPDEDGCVEAIGWCSTAPSVEQRGNTTVQRFTNTCPFRVYATMVNGRAAGGADAGADGVAAGANKSWSTGEGSGKTFIRVVGSTKAGSDWVCSGKFRDAGFRAGDSSLAR